MSGKPIIVLLLVALAAAVAPGRADDLVSSVPPEGWEYAELRIRGTDAVLVTAGEAMFLDGPEGREARKFIKLDNDHLRVGQSFRVLHLTRAGSQGWEVVGEIKPDTYLLKRRYRVVKPGPSP